MRKENEARRRQVTERQQEGKQEEEEEEDSSEGTRMVARMYLRWLTGGKKGGGGSRGEGGKEKTGEGEGVGVLGEGAESLLTVALDLLPHLSQSSQEDPVKEVCNLSSYLQTHVLMPANTCPHTN